MDGIGYIEQKRQREQVELITRFFHYLKRKESISIVINIEKDGYAQQVIYDKCKMIHVPRSGINDFVDNVYTMEVFILKNNLQEERLRFVFPIGQMTFTGRRTIYRKDAFDNSIEIAVHVNK